MGLEATHDLPARTNNAHVPIGAAEEEAVGAGANACDLVALEEGAGFVVVGEFDLADIEEVK